MGNPREGEFGAALLKRMGRNRTTPTIFGRADDFGLAREISALVDLAERPPWGRGCWARSEHPGLAGTQQVGAAVSGPCATTGRQSMGKGQKRRRDPMGVRPTPGARSQVLAWADAHSIDCSNEEADDLVRRLRNAPSDGTGADARDGDDKSPDSADGGKHPTPSRGIPDMLSPPDNDHAPGMAVGEGEDGCRPLRYDYLLASPVAVTVGGEQAVAMHAPYDGRVRVRPEREDARAIVVALDDLDDAGRSALLAAPMRRRIEIIVRCRTRRCPKCYRAWLSGDGSVEDTSGREICKVQDLFLARCGDHKRGRRTEEEQPQD